MAYICAERVAEKRAALKKAFPGWKFGVRRDGHSAIDVKVLAAPYDIIALKVDGEWKAEAVEKKRAQVNPYYIDSGWMGQAKDDLKKIKDILFTDHYDNSNPMEDYFDTAWYVWINIGSYDKPFQVMA